MRRLIPVSVTIFMATLLVSFVTISANAQTTSQYADEDPASQESTAQEPSATVSYQSPPAASTVEAR